MSERKNIILFLTDQWRWDTLNINDHPAKLPNLREFQKQSTQFPNTFTTVPLCTPARGSLFTGKLPHQNGTMDNVQGKSFYPFGKLHPKQSTYLERLSDAGYHVSFIGKWHLGDGTLHERGITDTELSDGGDTAIMTTAAVSFSDTRNSPYFGTVIDGTPLDEQRVQRAIDKLPLLAKNKQPFCLVISLHGPHFPHHVPERHVARYKDLPTDFMPDNWCPQFSEKNKPVAQSAFYWPCQDTSGVSQQDWRRTAQHYWGFCTYLDELFGRLMTAVSDNELDDKSVVAFTSDHGEMLGAHGWFDKGPFFYEEVIRIPMIIRDPALPGDDVHDEFVSLRDLFSTLIERAGASSMLDQQELPRSYWKTDATAAFYVYDAYQGRQFRFRGVHTGRYKYAWSPHDSEELYDLDNDAQERTNVAKDPEYIHHKSRLKRLLFDWMKEEGDWLPNSPHHLPVGSYIDGRDRSEQHKHPA